MTTNAGETSSRGRAGQGINSSHSAQTQEHEATGRHGSGLRERGSGMVDGTRRITAHQFSDEILDFSTKIKGKRAKAGKLEYGAVFWAPNFWLTIPG